MKFDTVIIGGGLAGLLCGLKLIKAGQNCAIVSAGQNAMHFSSGSFELLSRNEDGSFVPEPLKAIENLSENHPYRKIGAEKISGYTDEFISLFKYADVNLTGNPHKNSFMLSPSGILKTAWLGLEDVTLLDSKDEVFGNKILIVNLKSYLDFNTSFIADGLEKMGSKCRIEAVDLPEMDYLRSSPSEMRSVNIARVMDNSSVRASFIEKVKALIKDEDLIVLPAVFGFKDASVLDKIKRDIPVKTMFVGTMPPSIPGFRSQLQMKAAFELKGGCMMAGDNAKQAEISDGKVAWIKTENLEDVALEADNFVLATGSFFSKGLWATPSEIVEPLFGLDVYYKSGRENWYEKDFFKSQNYLGYGVETDSFFRPSKNGKTISNLYAIGSVLGGYNPIDLGCGSGVTIMSALAAADNILGN